MNKTIFALSGIGVGAGLMYLLDPETGNRRRALLRDQVRRSANVTQEAMGTTWRDARNRAVGVARALQSRVGRGPADDRVLRERVRSRLGFLVRHPSSVEVDVRQGRVILSGPVLRDEVERLLSEIERVPGLADIENRLEVHDEPGNIPGLQGQPAKIPRRRQFEFLQTNWSPSARMTAGTLGAAMVAYGLSHRSLRGRGLAVVGLALIARAVTNLEFQRLTGVAAGRRAVDITKTITVSAPLEHVFSFWANYENFPHFMSRVRQVEKTGEGRSRWRLEGPGGVPLTWNAVLTRFVPNRELAWKTEPDSAIQHAGIVTFSDNNDGTTTIHIRMTYNPPAGAIGHSVARMLGEDRKRLLDEDLVRMKSRLETGVAPRDAAQKE